MTTRQATPARAGAMTAMTVIALGGILPAGCADQPRAPAWEVRQDPGGLGYWAGPVGGEQRFYPSAYSNPKVNAAGGPAR